MQLGVELMAGYHRSTRSRTTTMVLLARKFPETPVEDSHRLNRLEAHAEHFIADLTEIKSELKELRKDLGALALSMEKTFAASASNTEKRFAETNAAIATLAMSTEKRFAETNAAIAALALSTEKGFTEANAAIAALAMSTEKGFAAAEAARAALELSVEKANGQMRVWFFMMSAGLLAVVARAFHWL